jgi:hypothetical protein
VPLDKPVATLDAHVGKALFHGAIMGLRARGNLAIVLIKHALHFLPKADDMCPSRAARLRNTAHRTPRADTLESGRVFKGGTYLRCARGHGRRACAAQDVSNANSICRRTDISRLGLRDLRSKIGIILQEVSDTSTCRLGLLARHTASLV